MDDSTMLCAVGDVRMECRPTPKPALDKVLVGVRPVGICGSDARYFAHEHIGDVVVEDP
ncbi:MAG: hypothetical protein R6V13_07480 [Anaerolineae bacterium]